VRNYPYEPGAGSGGELVMDLGKDLFR